MSKKDMVRIAVEKIGEDSHELYRTCSSLKLVNPDAQSLETGLRECVELQAGIWNLLQLLGR